MNQQPALNFETAAIPYQAGSHTSHKAALWLASKGDRPLKVRTLMEAYKAAGERGLNDSEASAATSLPRSSICSLRSNLSVCGLIEKAGQRVGAYQILQQVWAISDQGRAARG